MGQGVRDIMKLSYSRKVLLINKKFQLSIILWFIALSTILISFYYFANFYFFQTLIKEAQAAGLPSGHVYFTHLADQKSYMNQIFLLTSIVTFITIALGGLVLSHKVAGPLYRLTQHLKGSSPENIKPVQFRKGDYFPEVQDAFNEFIKR